MSEFVISDNRIAALKRSCMLAGSTLIFSAALGNGAVYWWSGEGSSALLVSLGRAAILWILWTIVSRVLLERLRSSRVSIDGGQVVIAAPYISQTFRLDGCVHIKRTVDVGGHTLAIALRRSGQRITLEGYDEMDTLYEHISRCLMTRPCVSETKVRRGHRPQWMARGTAWILVLLMSPVFAATLVRLYWGISVQVLFLGCVCGAIAMAFPFALRTLPETVRRRWSLYFLIAGILLLTSIVLAARALWE